MRGQRPLRARLAAVPLPARAVATGGAAVVVAVAALALRLGGLGDVAPDPFYDAAVRSMGLSWHNFLFGALEPGGSVSIDKPAVALWPQVATTRLLGFSTATLVLPSALAGLAAVALLQRLAAMLWGRAAGWAAAAALAVAPLAVLTDRSDTMDSLAVALSLAAAVALVAATGAEERDADAGRWLIAAAGAAVGAGFAVKLFQGLIPVPALALLYVAASPLGWGERLSRLVLWAAVGTAVGLSWFLVVSTAPGREQPWAYGSHDGTALSAAFVYDGLGRLAGPASGAAGRDAGGAARGTAGDAERGGAGGAARGDAGSAERGGAGGAAGVDAGSAERGGAGGAAGSDAARTSAARTGARTRANDAAPARRTSTLSCSTRPTLLSSPAGGCPAAPAAAGDLAAAAAAPPGPTRLVSKHADLRGLLGVELLPALVIGGLALVLGWRAARLPRAGAIFIAAWLLTGVAVLSFLPDLKVRYVDVLAPPVAAALGVGLISITQRKAIGAVLLAVLLAAPVTQAVRVVQQNASDSGHLGALTPAQATQLSDYLAPRTQHQRFELASATAAKAAPLIEHDARPVLMLGTQLGHELTSLKTLRKDVKHDEVRFVLISGRCGPRTALTGTGCGRAARWAKVHGHDVSENVQMAPGTLYALIPASARAGTHGATHARRRAGDPHRRRRVDAT